jgi:hypothetical protein
MGIKNILLVDDDAAVNFLNKFLLTASNKDYDISVAVNGRDAIKSIIASSQCPDVIFLDINACDGRFRFSSDFSGIWKVQWAYTGVYAHLVYPPVRQGPRSYLQLCKRIYGEATLRGKHQKPIFS